MCAKRIIGWLCPCSASSSPHLVAALPPSTIPLHSRSTTCSYWMHCRDAAAPVTMARTASWRCYPEVLAQLPSLLPNSLPLSSYPASPFLTVRATKLIPINFGVSLCSTCSDPAIVPLPWSQIRVRPVHLMRLGRWQAIGSLLRRHDLVMLCGQRSRCRGKSTRGAGQQHK